MTSRTRADEAAGGPAGTSAAPGCPPPAWFHREAHYGPARALPGGLTGPTEQEASLATHSSCWDARLSPGREAGLRAVWRHDRAQLLAEVEVEDGLGQEEPVEFLAAG